MAVGVAKSPAGYSFGKQFVSDGRRPSQGVCPLTLLLTRICSPRTYGINHTTSRRNLFEVEGVDSRRSPG
jgi:hypothetical protein